MMSATAPFKGSYSDHGPYKGGTHEGLRSGKGRYKFANAFFEYEGEWVDGVMHGDGQLRMGDGGSYEGTFENGSMNGVGMRRWPDGSTYSGQFANGELHGEGMYISAKGEQYEGTFQRNLREGQGTLMLETGDKYEGEFAKHRMNGNGAMHYADGARIAAARTRCARTRPILCCCRVRRDDAEMPLTRASPTPLALWPPCSQMEEPPQLLHELLMRPCSQMPAPPQSRHRYFWRL